MAAMPDEIFHSRNISQDSTSSAGSASAFPLILDHILQYPGSYEIPLRTMYTLNSASVPRPGQAANRSTASSMDSDTSNGSSNSPVTSASQFTSALMTHIAKLPAQPCSLPPNFIISFVRRCFHPELTMVDFPQGLAAMDYLRDLEHRRKKEVSEAFKRLGLEASTSSEEREAVLAQYPGVARWVQNMELKEQKVDQVYSQLYIGLRRWILINEMCLEPFNKHNCMAMLNTLYPPMNSTAPTKNLSVDTLQKQRDSFFKWIGSVERHGKGVLRDLQAHGKAPEDPNGWPAVVKLLEKYLNTAKKMIDDSVAASVEDFAEDDSTKRNSRKTDSGVSFGSEQSRVSAGQSSTTTVDSRPRGEDAPFPAPSIKGLSTIEKISREFRRMRSKSRSRIEVEEIRPRAADDESIRSDEPLSPRLDRISRLKRMKSAGALSSKFGHSGSASLYSSSRQNSEIPQFDPEAMKRHRQLYDERSKHSHKNSA